MLCPTLPRPTVLDRLIADYERTGSLPTIGGGDHQDDQTDPTDPKDHKDQTDQRDRKDDWKPDADQQAIINRWLADERRKTEERIKAEAEEAAEAERKAKEQEDAEKRGEFETVKASLQGQIDTITAERDSLKAEHEALSTFFAASYEAALAELPEVVTAFQPADDAPFAEKVDWLTKAQKAAAKAPVKGPAHRPNPRPTTPQDESDEAHQRARSASRARYRV